MSKMSAEVKPAINNLCKHLNILYNTNLKPELFRLAKFNKTEENVVTVFWNLLSKICMEEHSDCSIRNIKLHLLRQNYDSLEFYALPESKKYGSRELLLAVGFLISKGALHVAVNLKIRNSPFNPNFIDDKYISRHNIDLNDVSYSKDDLENLTQWLEGKIKYTKRSANDYNDQISKIKTKISHSLPKIKEVYSVSELLALKNTEHSEKYLNDTSFLIIIIQNHEKWLKTENVFWEWMESVITERDTNKSEICHEALTTFLIYAKENL